VATKSFINSYLEYQQGTEAPLIYHRWCAITGIGALLGRRAFVIHGHNKIYANQYVMLVGESGARKDTALRGIRKLLIAADYNTIAADKTTKEKFLIDLEEGMDKAHDPDERFDVTKNDKHNPTMRALFGHERSSEPSECLIYSGEFNSFLGHNNVEFIDLLTALWDWEGDYKNRIKNGRSVIVPDPTISILSGNTPIGISMAFPIEVIGQGLFSRLIQVFSDPSGRRITFPPPPPESWTAELITTLKDIKLKMQGQFQFTAQAMIALDDIYQTWKELEDVRFKSYSSRRFTHLLKLCLVCAAARQEKYINIGTVIEANSVLHYTEYFMPKALGEFGKARNSDVTEKILKILEEAEKPLDVIEIWPKVSRDLDNAKQLGDLLRNIQMSGKINSTADGKILIKKVIPKWDFVHSNVRALPEYLENQAKAGLPL
jgi:hypothetical protein